jgi:hypothetical protein
MSSVVLSELRKLPQHRRHLIAEPMNGHEKPLPYHTCDMVYNLYTPHNIIAANGMIIGNNAVIVVYGIESDHSFYARLWTFTAI